MAIQVIHILGASGAGTSTLGRAIEETYGFKHLDTDAYYWLPTNPAFTTPREKSERIRLMKADILKHKKCVISGALCGWGDELIPKFELVIRMITPTAIRIQRLKEREFGRFGKRILENGDMYQNHQEFMEWAASYDEGDLNMRSKKQQDQWLGQVSCKQIEMDGALEMPEKLKQLEELLKPMP